MTWVNPYLIRVDEFPGALCSFANARDVEQFLGNIFGSYNEVFFEIGSGSGMYLVELARRFPNVACIGVELRYKRAVRTAEKASQVGLDNLFVLRGDYQVVAGCIPRSSLDKLIVNFPDPWEKPKQRKNRVLSKPLLDWAETVLKPNAAISVKTDHSEYFGSFLKVLQTDGRFQLTRVTDDLHTGGLLSDRLDESEDIGIIATEFEMLFQRQGVKVSHLYALRDGQAG